MSHAMTIGAKATPVVEVSCPRGYYAAAGYVVEQGPSANVYMSGRFRAAQTTWLFRVENASSQPDEVRFEVRCVRFPDGIDIKARVSSADVPTGQPPKSFTARCTPGKVPLGAGLRRTRLGTASLDPPGSADAAITRLEPGATAFGVRAEPTAGEGMRVQVQAICVERRQGGTSVNVARPASTVNVPAGGTAQRALRCPRGTVATSGGWAAPAGSGVVVEPVGWTGARTLDVTITNGSASARSVKAYVMCVSQRRS